MELIQCVKIETNGTFIVGEFSELHELIENIVPHAEDLESGETVTITFPKMTQEELDALPEFEG